MVADTAIDTAAKVGGGAMNAGSTVLRTVFNAKTAVLIGGLALTGVVAASTGIAVPITEINSTATAAAADSVSGWSVAGGAATDTLSHAWNGGATILDGAKNVATGADWSTVGDNLGNAFDALTPEA